MTNMMQFYNGYTYELLKNAFEGKTANASKFMNF